MSHSHHRHDNPFFNRQRIVDPTYFRGRHQAVESLYSAIATRQCRSIVGERKMGKSSLLTNLSCPDTLRDHGFDMDRFVFVYVDMEGMANISYEEFWPEILDGLSLALPEKQTTLRQQAGEMAAQPAVRFMQVRRLLRRVERAGLTMVMMLDEFESLATNAAFDTSFYGELRSLAGELGVVYLTTSKRGLYDLTYEHSDTLSSPFFNIFSEERLQLMPREEAVDLLQYLSALPDGRPFTQDQVDFCLNLGGTHPFFLQIVASYLFAARLESAAVGKALYARVTRHFKAEAEDHFRYWWQQLTEEEQHGLLNLPACAPDVQRRLQRKALLVEVEEGSLQPFCSAFADFLSRTDPIKRPFAGQSRHSTTRLTGTTLGNYRVLSPIGRGGMAVVYKGYQSSLDRYVAIKVMSRTLVGEEAFVERFQREAAGVARLHHQNIVQMVDFGVHDDISFMVMEYIEGKTLKERLGHLNETGERMSLAEVGKIINGICAALDYAHAHGIVHRDVKPANIMLRREERLAELTGADLFTAVLTDFGVARMLEGAQITGTGATIGTPDYMSPEQAQGNPAAAASDIYSLGIVLFEMLTGKLPFTADTPVAVLLKHMQADPPSATQLVPELPSDLEAILIQALSKRPQDRFATAGQMARALSGVVE